MSDNNNILKIVSNETKASIEQLDVVTPTIFSSIFSQFASANNLELEDEEKTAHELMRVECSILTELQDKTSASASRLSDSTSKAIVAIQEKDEAILNIVLRETQQLKEEIEKLKETVYKDVLTNTYNRKWLQDNYIKHKSNVSKKTGVLALMDLNYFKVINDTYGHVIGDRVLVFLAGEFLTLGFPVIRYGGDEFIIMFPENISQNDALKILTDLRESILKKNFKASKKTFKVSFSFGLQKFNSDEVCTDILEAADQNMYKDKEVFKKRIASI